MKILVDENIPLMTVETLVQLGHDVLDLRGTDHQGKNDDAVWSLVRKGRRMLITTDKGFINHRQENNWGILIIRLRQPNRLRIHQHVMQMVRRFSDRDWPNMVVVARDTVQSIWKKRRSDK